MYHKVTSLQHVGVSATCGCPDKHTQLDARFQVRELGQAEARGASQCSSTAPPACYGDISKRQPAGFAKCVCSESLDAKPLAYNATAVAVEDQIGQIVWLTGSLGRCLSCELRIIATDFARHIDVNIPLSGFFDSRTKGGSQNTPKSFEPLVKQGRHPLL